MVEKQETKITVTELAMDWSRILGRVQFTGETFIVSKYKKAIAKIVPINGTKAKRKKAERVTLRRVK